MKRVIRVLFSLIFLSSYVHVSCWGGTLVDVQAQLEEISKDDREYLSDFFAYLLQHCSFGYTLFGNKPATIEHWVVTLDNPFISKLSSEGKCIVEKGCQVWNQHSHRFPMEKFILGTHCLCKGSKTYREIYLVNQELCSRLAKEYPAACQRVSGEPFLLSLLQQDLNLPDAHFYFGLFLGYGYHNSRNFQRLHDIMNQLYTLPKVPEKIPPKIQALDEAILKTWSLQKKAVPQKDFFYFFDAESLLSDLHKLKENWTSFLSYDEENPLSMVPLPTFMVDSIAVETMILYNDYTKTRKHIVKVIKSPNFLEIVLTKLCEKNE